MPEQATAEPFDVTRSAAAMRLGISRSSVRRNLEPEVETRRDARGRVVFRRSDVERYRLRQLGAHENEAELFELLDQGARPADLVIQRGLNSEDALRVAQRYADACGCLYVPGHVVDDLRRVLELDPEAELTGETLAMTVRRFIHERTVAFERELEDRAKRLANDDVRLRIAKLKAEVERDKIAARKK